MSVRECGSLGCCNSSQQRIYKDQKVSGCPRRRGLFWRMTFLFLRFNCKASAYCYLEATCYGVNDWCSTGASLKLQAHINPTQVTTFSSLFADPLRLISRIICPSVGRWKRTCTTVVVLKNVTVPVAPTQYIDNRNTHVELIISHIRTKVRSALFGT